jgi:hypothetical protein
VNIMIFIFFTVHFSIGFQVHSSRHLFVYESVSSQSLLIFCV